MRGLVILLLSILFSSVLLAQKGKYPIKNFTPSDYRAGIQNIDFAQNRNLSIYVANNLGVLSFNGNEWETHTFNSGIKQRSLAFDESSNRLFVGSQGEIGYFENNWTYVSLTDLIPQELRGFDDVWDVYVMESRVYFCTFQGIYIYDGEMVETIKSPVGFNRTFLVGDRLFTQYSSGELFEISGARLEATSINGNSERTISGLVQYKGGYLIFYNSGRIQFNGSMGLQNVFPALAEVLAGNFVNHVTQLADTRWVISTQRQGLFLFDEQTGVIENISIEDGLLSNACLRVFQDYNGNVWVGMQNGIALVDINAPLRLINQEIELQGSGYEAFETSDGTYYTTSNGIYFQGSDGGISNFLEGTEGPAYGVQEINDKIYAGHHTGLFLLEGGNARRIATTDGLWEVKQLRSDPRYAIGGTYSGIYLFETDEFGTLRMVRKVSGFEESSRFFEEDRRGNIWVGQYYKGIYKLEFNDTFSSVDVTSLTDLNDQFDIQYVVLTKIDDDLCLSTDKGIYRIDTETHTIIEDEVFSEEIGKEWIYLLAQDEKQNVHIYSENHVGFFRQISQNNYVYVPSSLFQLRQSFNNDLLRVSVNTREGIMYNANEGFIRYNPELETKRIIDQPPVVSRIYNVSEDSVMFMRMPFEANLEVDREVSIREGSTRALQFKVESFRFRDINNQRFRYFLEGFDQDYSEWSNTTIKEYTNLPEGKYEFYVQSVNSLGEILTSNPVRVIVNPPFYRSTFAKILYLFLIAGLLYLAYRLQRLYYLRKQETMEKLKQQELAQKQEELQELKEEQIKSELRNVSNLLAASTMNLVVKNEFMENIKEEIRRVKSEGDVRNTEQALERIIKEIDTTLKVQEDWQQFEYHFDRVHGDFLSRLTNEFVDLTPGEQKLCAFLRLKMDTKEISNLMGISLRGVEVARYRLRKKLGLSSRQNLSKFILEY